MLIASKQIVGCSLQGDGDSIGKVKDILFDEETWDVRYLDIDTGGWLYDRRVILSTATIHAADYVVQQLGTKLSREQVDKSPPLESDLPVSRRKEIELAKYYSWGAYWATLKETGGGVETEGDPHLRSVRAVTGYRIEATDGDIGHIDDFIVDDGDLRTAPWGIRYLVIDTRNWLPGRRVSHSATLGRCDRLGYTLYTAGFGP